MNMQAFVPKNRKPKFNLTLKILDLNNIPLVYGTAYVKWHLSSSTSADEHRGRTEKVLIRDHKASWDYLKEMEVRLTIDKNQTLQDSEIQFEVSQEYDGGIGGRGSKVILGVVKLNLAEYADQDEDVGRNRAGRDTEPEDEGGITRRYLLQESKINCTLKIGILLKQIEGETNYIAPPLKSAMAFGGIAGIVAGDAGDGDDTPNVASKMRELSDLQEVYRRTLAASWATKAGELPPDKLIEDLFAGGDGGRMEPPKLRNNGGGHHGHVNHHRPRDDSVGSSTSDSESRRTITPHQLPHNGNHLSPEEAREGGAGHRRTSTTRNSRGSVVDANISPGTVMTPTMAPPPAAVSGRESIDQQIQHSHMETRRRDAVSSIGKYEELTEFDMREDLRSWQIKAR